jgi:hypothetical protein
MAIKNRELMARETRTDRIAAHSLQNLFRYGKIIILQGRGEPLSDEQELTDPNVVRMRRDVSLGPHLHMSDSYGRTLMAIMDKYEDDRGRFTTCQNGHRNMLKN